MNLRYVVYEVTIWALYNMECNIYNLFVLCFSVKSALCAESCLEIIMTDRWSPSGVYILKNQQGESYEVFCVFEQSMCTTYISSLTNVPLDIDKHYNISSSATLRYFNPSSGTQGEVMVSQLGRFQDEPIGFIYNDSLGYSPPIYGSRNTYLYLGFVPRTLINKNEIQGYRAGNKEYTFTNCDGNQNCHFTFYFGQGTTLESKPGNTLSMGWITSATNLAQTDFMDERFYFPVEIHMGGCGALSTSTGMGGIKGALGLLSDIPPACQPNPCLNGGTCSENGTAYVCSCLSTYHGQRCELEQTCMCPCSNTGLKWAYLSNLNISRDELKILLKDEIEQIQKELKVDTKTTNSYYRSHHSASDDRTSAVSTGLVGVILLCLPIVLFVTLDIMRLFQR